MVKGALRPSIRAVDWPPRSGGVTDRCGHAEASASPAPHYRGKKKITACPRKTAVISV